MAVPFSNTKLRVPKGFQNILECLAREVLRSQPDNIHEFAAAYFEKMLKVRTETGHDPAIHGAKLEDRNYNNETFKKRSVDPSDPQQQQAAVTIQSQFRQHSAKGEVKAMREEDAATRIQAGFRGFMDREQVRSMKDDDNAKDEGQEKAAEEEEVDIDLNDPEVEKAAIKIQAGFKGFKARKDVTGTGEDEKPRPASTGSGKQQAKQEEEVDIDLTDPEVAQAALKIQAGFRGHQARQEVIAHKAAKDTSQKPASLAPQSEEKAKPNAAPEEEEVDIDLDDPDVEKAAVKIQAGFKGLKARKNLKQKQEETPAPATEEPTTSSEPAKPQEEEIDIDLEDPATEKAALKIQASFRGFQTRKDMSDKKPDGGESGEQTATEAPAEPAAQAQEAEAAPAAEAQEEVDIDLEDPEVEKAAMKIQAGFKGFKARKELESKSPGREGDAVDGAPSQEQQEPAAEEAPKVDGEGQGQEEVKASEEETQPKEIVGEAQQQEAEAPAEEAAPAAAAEGEQQAAEEDKGGE